MHTLHGVAARGKCTRCFLTTALHLDEHREAKGDFAACAVDSQESTRTRTSRVNRADAALTWRLSKTGLNGAEIWAVLEDPRRSEERDERRRSTVEAASGWGQIGLHLLLFQRTSSLSIVQNAHMQQVHQVLSDLQMRRFYRDDASCVHLLVGTFEICL